MTDTNWKDDLIEYRKQHFMVEVKPSDHPLEEGEVLLSITHDGRQWNTLSLLKSEVPQVIRALMNSLK